MKMSQEMTQEEIDACRDAFLAFDKDKSGTIDHWELKQVLEAMGQTPSDEEIFQMISEVDDNDSNTIDFSEFLTVIAKQKKLASESGDSDIIEAWVAVGGDRPKGPKHPPTGVVDASKLIKIIKCDFGLTIDVEKLLEELDLDGNGTIDFEEFSHLLA